VDNLKIQNQIDTDKIYITQEDSLDRLDKLLALRYPDFSRTYFQNLIDKGSVLLNGERIKKRIVPKYGDEVSIIFEHPPEISLEPEDIPLDILFEDEHILVVNKQANFVVHPGAGNPNHTFVNALLHHCKNLSVIDDSIRPGIVHRLDKDTTGVLIAAKTKLAHTRLMQTFANRRNITKLYLAICVGNPKDQTVSLSIGRDPKNRKEMATLSEGGKEAITHVKTLGVNDTLSFVLLRPVTGRTHQLRVHLKSLNTPILGDQVYGIKKANEKHKESRQLLHAYKLCLPHPIHKTPMEFVANLPQDFRQRLEKSFLEVSEDKSFCTL